MKVLLLGASGHIGRRVAAELLRHAEIEQLTLAGRDEGVLQRMADRMRGRAEIAVSAFDISRDAVAEHARGHDRIVSCAGPGYKVEADAVDGALQAGVDYLSLNDDFDAARQVSGRHGSALENGVTILSGCGVAPGLSDLLVALAVEGLEKIEEIEISFAASTADAGGKATDLHFVAMMDGAARDGVDSGDDGARAPHAVHFPDPVGWIETFPCSHPEELSIARDHPNLAAFEFRVGLAEKAVMDVVRASIAARLTRGERRRQLWLRSSAPVRPMLEKLSPKAAPWTGLRVDVRGRPGGRSKTVSYAVVDHLVNLASIAIAQAVIALPSGEPFGVVSPGQVFEPRSFLRKVADRGLTFARLEPHQL